MTTADEIVAPMRLEGKFKAMMACFVLGLGSLVAWNSMVTIGDYYYQLFPDSKPIQLKQGQEIIIFTDYSLKGDQNMICMSYKKLAEDVKPGMLM